MKMMQQNVMYQSPQGQRHREKIPKARFHYDSFNLIAFTLIACTFLCSARSYIYEIWEKIHGIKESTIRDPKCPKKPRRGIEGIIRKDKLCAVGEVITEEPLECIINHISILSSYGPQYALNLRIGNSERPVRFLVDTGCTASVISLHDVKQSGMLHLVDTSMRTRYEAMGGGMEETYGTLKVPIRTKHGFTVLSQIEVAEMGVLGGLLGLDVLARLNCSLILDDRNPRLQFRSNKTTCCGCSPFRKAAKLKAKLNGKLMYCVIDTGAARTVLPCNKFFKQATCTRTRILRNAGPHPIYARKKVRNLKMEINGNIGFVCPLLLPERCPMIGTDFLKNKRIDMICGKAYVTKC